VAAFRRSALILYVLALASVFLLAAIEAVAASGFRVQVKKEQDRAPLRVICNLEFSQSALVFDKADSYDIVRMEGMHLTREAGEPAVPVGMIHVALPTGMKVTKITATAEETVDIAGAYLLKPGRPPKPIGEGHFQTAVSPHSGVYSSRSLYPDQLASFARQYDLAGQSVAVIKVHPLRYMPAEKRLSLATQVRVLVEGDEGYVCGDYLPSSMPDYARDKYLDWISTKVANPFDVALVTEEIIDSRLWNLDPGQYDYVIITQDSWTDDFQPLADWRTRMGCPAKIVSREWIYNWGGYSGSDLQKIHDFIEDAHSTWGTTHFLIGGDAHIIPYHIRTITVPGYWTDDIPNDTYYADYDEDWVCEVNVTRAPVRNTDAISSFIDKVFKYEKDPPRNDYVESAVFFGMDITVIGDMDGEICKENIRRLHLPTDWLLDTEYDSELGPHKTDMLNYLNQGHHLVNHHDHCNSDVMGAGWISHGDLITISEAAILDNGDRQSIVFAVGCLPCDFPTTMCIGEQFIRNDDGGAIAYFGNTRTGWGGDTSDPDWYSVRQDRYFYRNLFDDGFEAIGDNFSDLKNDEYEDYDPYNLHQYCFTQLHLFGDPRMPVWTEEPETLAVSHKDTVPAGIPTAMVVEVDCDGAPVDGATVCLCKEDDVYEIEETSLGAATFVVTAASPGTLFVTVTKHNYLPYEGQAIVVEDLTAVSKPDVDERAGFELISIAPNPFNPSTEISFSVPSSGSPQRIRLSIFNCRGQLVRALVNDKFEHGIHKVSWDGCNEAGLELPGGIYFCRLASDDQTHSGKLVLLK
jgi:hypothetical protein